MKKLRSKDPDHFLSSFYSLILKYKFFDIIKVNPVNIQINLTKVGIVLHPALTSVYLIAGRRSYGLRESKEFIVFLSLELQATIDSFENQTKLLIFATNDLNGSKAVRM